MTNIEDKLRKIMKKSNYLSGDNLKKELDYIRNSRFNNLFKSNYGKLSRSCSSNNDNINNWFCLNKNCNEHYLTYGFDSMCEINSMVINLNYPEGSLSSIIISGSMGSPGNLMRREHIKGSADNLIKFDGATPLIQEIKIVFEGLLNPKTYESLIAKVPPQINNIELYGRKSLLSGMWS